MFAVNAGFKRRSLSSLFGSASLDPRTILTSMGEIVYDWDIASDALIWGANAADVLGCTDLAAFGTGRAFTQAMEPDSDMPRNEAILASSDVDEGRGVPYQARYVLRIGHNRLVCVEDNGRWFADDSGKPVFAHGILRIVPHTSADLLAQEHRLRERKEFLRLAGQEIRSTLQKGQGMAILVAQIDNLDFLNEELGNEATDNVIVEVSRVMHGVMRRRDRMMRYGSNRFAILLSHCSVTELTQAATRFLRAVNMHPIITPQGPVLASLKIGGVCLPDYALDAPGALSCAEEALILARREDDSQQDENGFVMWKGPRPKRLKAEDPSMRSLDVIEALNERRVLFACQPVVHAQEREIAFHEVLARICLPDGRIVQASEALPSIERAGFISLIDMRMLELVTRHLDAHPEQRLSLNVSPLTLETGQWLSILAAHLGAHPGVAGRLILEITETAAIRNPDTIRARLNALKALGVTVAIDDFGAGHTSFKLLRSLPVDLLKIDGAFVHRLAHSKEDQFFVRTLIELAQNLNIATVAEWVEDEESAALLTQWGVDYLQGHHCGAPIMVERENGDDIRSETLAPVRAAS
jgi:diguanylate cyclase (GGDEF)-like protein